MTTLADSGQGMDVAIGGLGFKLATNKDQPYERATAQFRKEQFDTAPTVGDQSLTGWWTRGQLSFHKGAGLTYYEVLQGETVLDRYTDSEGVDVSDPGTVTLFPSLTDMALNTLDAVPASLAQGGGIYALTDTGVYYTAGSGATFIDTADSGVPTAITSSGSLYYVANGDVIERQYSTAEMRTNHITNPSFESGTTGWSVSVGTLSRTTGHSKYGTYSCTTSSVGGDPSFVMSGLTIGVTYIASAWVYWEGSPLGTAVLKIDSTTIDTSTAASDDAWERLSGTFVASATSHTFTLDRSPVAGFHFDACMFTESPFPGDYFDGSQSGCEWAGTPHASKSIYASPSNQDSNVLITLTGGATWTHVFWAKGRLWCVDSDGYWYALSATVQTVTSADAFWNSGKTGVNWSLAQGTGPVYISDEHDIYVVTVDTDGVIPTLSTPTTAARVPLGEDIACISYYLGYLIVATTRGVRVALTQEDQLLLGPLTMEGDFSHANRVGAFDTKTYVVGRLDGHGGDEVLCCLDLAQFVTDLTPAWFPISVVSDMASEASGACVDATGRVHAWAAEMLLAGSPDEITEEGSLTTGFHRFGTLEPKFFSDVLVRIGGTGGEVEVFRVDADGTETSLQTLTASGTVPLGLTAVAERIALKFVLSRDEDDPTKGPELLGYQLRALPAPQRQRMIRVPLLLKDVERRGGTRAKGYDGSAWARLSALEAMEESGAVHDWQDFRTGETASVFIETVEYQGTTPPANGSDGFGGTVFVTMRRV